MGEQLAHRPDIVRLLESRAGWVTFTALQHGIWAVRHRLPRLRTSGAAAAAVASETTPVAEAPQPPAPCEPPPQTPDLADVAFAPGILYQRPRILIDATPTVRHRPAGGIARVVRGLAEAGVKTGLALPVHIIGGALHSYYAHPLLSGPIEPRPGDIYVIADVFWYEMAAYRPIVAAVRQAGALVALMVHDLGAIRRPELFPPDMPDLFRTALCELLEDSAFCFGVSRTVEADLRCYLTEIGHSARNSLRFGHVLLGVEKTPSGTAGLRRAVTALFDGGRSFLSVGTIEPRKGYDVTLDAAELAWSRGGAFALVILGRYGWCAEALRERIRSHPESGRRLFWTEDASDAELAYAYSRCRSLVQASLDEGFCLPVSEAAVFAAAVIASDLPVIREIAGDEIDYFPPGSAEALSQRLLDALAHPPRQAAFPVRSWRDAVSSLARQVLPCPATISASQPKGGEPIQVACCFDAKLAQQAGVLAASVAATTQDAPVHFHMVGPTDIASVLAARLKRPSFTIVPHPAPATDGDLYCTEQYSDAVYYRLSLPELIEADRVIYLDCDVMVCRSLSALWQTDLQSHPIAATVDLLSLTYQNGDVLAASHKGRAMTVGDYCRTVLALDLDRTDYFNSGVMVIDLGAWRRDRIAERARALCGADRQLNLVDQDALNQLLGGDFLPLDQRWNALVYIEPAYRPRAGANLGSILGGFEPKLLPPSGPLQAALRCWREDPWIIHFAHCSKPWLARDRRTAHDGAWWDHAFGTPFGPALSRGFVQQLASC